MFAGNCQACSLLEEVVIAAMMMNYIIIQQDNHFSKCFVFYFFLGKLFLCWVDTLFPNVNQGPEAKPVQNQQATSVPDLVSDLCIAMSQLC